MPEVHDITSAPKPRRFNRKFVIATAVAAALAVTAVVVKKNTGSSDENGTTNVETPAA